MPARVLALAKRLRTLLRLNQSGYLPINKRSLVSTGVEQSSNGGRSGTVARCDATHAIHGINIGVVTIARDV